MENLLEKFGFTDFKSQQQYQGIVEVLRAETNVFIHLPPGAGKSLCYQLPAILSPEKSVIVFVPSISSSNGAVEFLKSRQIDAVQFGTHFVKTTRNLIKHKQLFEKKINILFVTLSLCKEKWFQEYLEYKIKKNLISFFVLDEAHCISKMTLDYNNHYEWIKIIQSLFPSIKFVVLASRIPPQVKLDVLSELNMKNATVIESTSVFNSNIWLEVIFMDLIENPLEHMIQLITNSLKNEEDRAIIFCRKVDQTCEASKQLAHEGFPSVIYNCKMSKHQRNKSMSAWKSGQVKVIVATHDFVYGLHCKSVRCVIHWTMPPTISQYYRQISTAGRDEKPSVSRLYFSLQDEISFGLTKLKMSPFFYKDFQLIIDCCFSLKCRREIFFEWLGMKADYCSNFCDNCTRSESVRNMLSRFSEFKEKKKLVNLYKNEPTNMKHSELVSVEKFKFLNGVRKLESPFRPCFNVYTIFGMSKTFERIPVRWTRTFHLHLLLRALYKNYQKLIAPNDKNKNILRLGRILEYYAFATHRPRRIYHGEIRHMINMINTYSSLSNILINYNTLTTKTTTCSFTGSELSYLKIRKVINSSLLQHIRSYRKDSVLTEFQRQKENSWRGFYLKEIEKFI